MVFFQKGGGGFGLSKSFESLFFVLKQSKSNKCQCAKRLKTVKKLFLKFFVKEFWKKKKSEKSASKIPKGGGGGIRGFRKKTIFEPAALF